MKVAIIGSGISGLTAAYLLARRAEVHIFEAANYAGGHTHTHAIEHEGTIYYIDTGFIVFNDWTYPNFIKLLDALEVENQESDMSFSVRSARTGVEYRATNLDTLFAQRRNLVSPGYLRMLADVVRFRRELGALIANGDPAETLRAFVARRGYCERFVDDFLVPLGAAVWSASPADMLDRFPAHYFAQFFRNHGFLNLRDQPKWRVVRGGSFRYVQRLLATTPHTLHLRTPIEAINRTAGGVEVKPKGEGAQKFDHVVVAVHADQALRMLADADDRERDVLSAFEYQDNQAVLHTDSRFLPHLRKARASWNYFVPEQPNTRATVTYWMNRLQSIEAPVDFCVTLNPTAFINPRHTLRTLSYQHPIYSPAAVTAQQRWSEISGRRNTHFCGAYWGFGFHEDGVKSALAVGRAFGEELIK